MLTVIISLPPIKPGKDEEFREWFAWSNKTLANQKGLISRRLLKPFKDGNYNAVVEHERQGTFMTMHNSSEHDEVGKRVAPLLEGKPSPQFYEVIVG